MAAPLTAAALIAQQVGANAFRDGLFLSVFSVQSLPYFVAGTAVLAIGAAWVSGQLLARLGPARMVPALFALSAALFLVEWAFVLGGQSRLAAALLYAHSSVLGGIAISSFWSLLNERFDPHAAKPIVARVAASAALGGLIGGISAERVVALLPSGAFLPVLTLMGVLCIAGALSLGAGVSSGRRAVDESVATEPWVQFRQHPLLRDLALVVVLASVVATFADYLLKSEAVAYFGQGPQLVRFFGLYYACTGLAAVLLQAALGRLAIDRLGLGRSVATHPVVAGAAGLLAFVLPSPWRGLVPRGFDAILRNSIFRAGYELLYTPFADATKRSAKSIIDVGCDCAGRAAGAAVILVLIGLASGYPIAAVNLAIVLAAAGEWLVARRLRDGYVSVLEGGLRRHGEQLEQEVEHSMADFSVAPSIASLDRAAVLQAVGALGDVQPSAQHADPVAAEIVELRSGDPRRIRAALRDVPRDPLIIGALVPLLARDDVTRRVVAALSSFGARAAGEMVSALLDPATPDVIRRRLPLALKSCPTALARDGLRTALEGSGFEVRLRCGRALLALADEHPALAEPFPRALALVDAELNGSGDPALVREHVFNLLALALDREPVRIAARAFAGDDSFVRGTALEYLETVLPARVFFALKPLLAVTGPSASGVRSEAEVRADLMRAGETMTVRLDEVRRRLDAAATDDI